MAAMDTKSQTRNTTRRALVLLSYTALALAALGQTGCATSLAEWVHNGLKVGPNYQPPPTPVTPRWIDEDHPRVRVGEANLATWWEVFDDPLLNKLVHDAYGQNITVRQAGILILQARLQRNLALTELLPQGQTLAAQYTRGVVSRNNGVGPGIGGNVSQGLTPSTVVGPISTPTAPIAGAAPFTPAGTTTTGTSPLINAVAGGGGGGVPQQGSRFFDNIATSVNLAWELDLWGLFRRNLEAADANLDQSVHNRDAIVVQLLASVATQYVELRTLQKRLQLARRNVIMQEPLVAKLEQQYKTGIATSKPAYFQLKSNLDNTRALIPPLEIALRQANNQLCVLLGIPVRDLVPELGDGAVTDPNDPAKRVVHIPRPRDDTVVVGIPGELLLRRPDVQAMEQQLRIQSAQIGIAEAEMFPHVGINGSIGLAANHIGLLFNQQSWIGSIGPSLTWNILNYGRLLGNVRFQNNQYQQFVLAYQQAILNANQDAENALVAYLQSLEQAKRLQDSANDAVQVTKYYYDQLATGYLPPAATSLAFYNQVFTAVNFQVTQQDAAAQAEGNIALNLILLYRAMGGGWQLRLHDAPCDADHPLPAQAPPVSGIESLPAPRPAPPAVGPLESGAVLGTPIVQPLAGN
jgi:NodT family efflux transporter outer membrane factor (OMF) lipoprotein